MIILSRWHIFRVKSRLKADHNTVRAVGYSENGDQPYISDNIKAFDSLTGEVTTTEGVRVKLVGEPGHSMSVDKEWAAFCRKHRVTSIADLSTRYLPKRKRKAA